MKRTAFLAVCALLSIFAVPHAFAEAADWGLGFRSTVDFGSLGIEQDAIVTYKDRLYMGLDLVTSPKILFMLYPGTIDSDGLTRSWTYNIDLETRVEAGYLYAPWPWLSLRSGLDASLLMNFVKYHLSDATYNVDIPDFQNAYLIFEPALFLSVDLDYGTWLRAKALQGLDLRLGIRIPVRDFYYDYARCRLIIALGWEY
jgi:hypothetical protein